VVLGVDVLVQEFVYMKVSVREVLPCVEHEYANEELHSYDIQRWFRLCDAVAILVQLK
jgi:hypothetical protein